MAGQSAIAWTVEAETFTGTSTSRTGASLAVVPLVPTTGAGRPPARAHVR
ncbi:hypothetical protein [Nocardioides daphniae]|nr:hypothetical protein [Nocardioides daphniae]